MLTQEITVTRHGATLFKATGRVDLDGVPIDGYTDDLFALTMTDAITKVESLMEKLGYEARTGWTEWTDKETHGPVARNIFRAETV